MINVIDRNKLKFAIIENTDALGNYTYVLSTASPYFMFQVIGFATDKEFQEFIAAPTAAYGVIPGYRIVLSLAHSLAEPVYDTSKMDSYYEYFTCIMKDACDWFSDYRNIESNEVYSKFKL